MSWAMVFFYKRLQTRGSGGEKASVENPLNHCSGYWVWLERAGILLLLGITLWAARYWHSANFGLYEDDFTIIPSALTMSLDERLRFAADYILRLDGQGRPLHHSLIFLLPPLAWGLAGLKSVYWLGFVIVWLNGALFFGLLNRTVGTSLAVLGGLAYVLFSADTTQAYLTHAVGIQPALSLLLVAAHLYLSGRRGLAYLPALVSLYVYETPFLVFLAVPLLDESWDRRKAGELIRHGTAVLGLILATYMLRLFVAEDRAAALSLSTLIWTSAKQMLQGPPVSLGTYFLRPLQTLQTLDLESSVVAVVASAGLMAVLQLLEPARTTSIKGWRRAFTQGKSVFSEAAEEFRLVRLGIAGLAMLALAYPLTFTVRAYAISGRATRVHLAAVIGAAVVFAVATQALRSLSELRRFRRLTDSGLAILLGLLVAFGFQVQSDYIRSWDYQVAFWQELIPWIGDADENTAILIEPTGLLDTRHIDANTWNLPRILESIYIFPRTWSAPPQVYRLLPGWRDSMVGPVSVFSLEGSTVASPLPRHQDVSPENTILIETESGKMIRRTQLTLRSGQTLSLKSPMIPAPGLGRFQPGVLFDLIMGIPRPPVEPLKEGGP